MKFLTVPRLQRLSSLLQHVDLGDQIIHARVEAYSCKAAGDDKRLGKQLERQISEELAHSPVMSPTMSPLGPLTDANTRKLLISLITTMNASFPDYDFSNLRAEQFDREASPALAMNSLNVHSPSCTLSTCSPSLSHHRLLSSPRSFCCPFPCSSVLSLAQSPLSGLPRAVPSPAFALSSGRPSQRLSICRRASCTPSPLTPTATSTRASCGASATSSTTAGRRRSSSSPQRRSAKLHDDEEEDGEEDVDIALSSSGGEGGGGPYWDEGDDENNLLWDELEFGEGARLSEQPGRFDEQGQGLLPAGLVREVTDTASSPSSGARRRTKGKRTTTRVGSGGGKGGEEEKPKRRKRRTTTPKAAGNERRGKRAVREGSRKDADMNDHSKQLASAAAAAPAGSDDEERGGGRSLLDARRVPSPALGILPLASLVEAKDTAEAQRAQEVEQA